MSVANKLSKFTIGEDVIHFIDLTEAYKLDKNLSLRKAKVVSINKASISIQYYSYTKNVLNCGTTIYRWNDTLEPKNILVKNINKIRIRTTKTKSGLMYFNDLCIGIRSDGKDMDYDDNENQVVVEEVNTNDDEVIFDDDDDDDEYEYDLGDIEIVYVR